MMTLEEQAAEAHLTGGLRHLAVGGQAREDAWRGVEVKVEGAAHVDQVSRSNAHLGLLIR